MSCVSGVWKKPRMYSLAIEKPADEEHPSVWLGNQDGHNVQLTDDDIFKMLELFNYWKWADDDDELKDLFNKIDEILKKRN